MRKKLNGCKCSVAGCDRKEICLGTFETLKEAAIARKNGETKYFGEFSRNHNRSKGIEK